MEAYSLFLRLKPPEEGTGGRGSKDLCIFKVNYTIFGLYHHPVATKFGLLGAKMRGVETICASSFYGMRI